MRPVEPGEERRLILEVVVGNRGGGDAVLTEDLGRAPLQQLRGVAERRSLRPADHRVEIRVRMEVDEARCEHEAGPLDDLDAHAGRASSGADADLADRPARVDEDVRDPRIRTGPVDHGGATNPKRRPRPPALTHSRRS